MSPYVSYPMLAAVFTNLPIKMIHWFYLNPSHCAFVPQCWQLAPRASWPLNLRATNGETRRPRRSWGIREMDTVSPPWREESMLLEVNSWLSIHFCFLCGVNSALLPWRVESTMLEVSSCISYGWSKEIDTVSLPWRAGYRHLEFGG